MTYSIKRVLLHSDRIRYATVQELKMVWTNLLTVPSWTQLTSYVKMEKPG